MFPVGVANRPCLDNFRGTFWTHGRTKVAWIYRFWDVFRHSGIYECHSSAYCPDVSHSENVQVYGVWKIPFGDAQSDKAHTELLYSTLPICVSISFFRLPSLVNTPQGTWTSRSAAVRKTSVVAMTFSPSNVPRVSQMVHELLGLKGTWNNLCICQWSPRYLRRHRYDIWWI